MEYNNKCISSRFLKLTYPTSNIVNYDPSIINIGGGGCSHKDTVGWFRLIVSFVSSVRQFPCFFICLLEAAYSLSLASWLGPHHSTDLHRQLSDDNITARGIVSWGGGGAGEQQHCCFL